MNTEIQTIIMHLDGMRQHLDAESNSSMDGKPGLTAHDAQWLKQHAQGLMDQARFYDREGEYMEDLRGAEGDDDIPF